MANTSCSFVNPNFSNAVADTQQAQVVHSTHLGSKDGSPCKDCHDGRSLYEMCQRLLPKPING
jgi:hypothetical protein